MKTLKTIAIIIAFFSTSMVFGQEMKSNKVSKSKTMKMYLIERDMPGVGSLTKKDLKNASQKSNDVIKELGPGIEWIKSYVVDDKLYCVYKAQNKEIIKKHAEKGGFPATHIMEVKENIGPSTAYAKTD